MTDKDIQNNHPCFECARTGKGGAYYKSIGHPIIVCSIDNHESINIVGLKLALDHLHEKCPKK